MWPFSKPNKKAPEIVYPNIPFGKQRPIDYDIIDAALENPNLESAIDKLPGDKPRKVIPGRADPRALDAIYGEGRIGGKKK